MNYKIIFFPLFFLCTYINVSSQNYVFTQEKLALTKIESPSFIISFDYNQYGQVASETRIGVGNEYINYKFEYEYDDEGNIILLTKTDPNLIHKEENEYNADNQIVVKKIYEDYGTGFKFLEQYFYTYQDTLLQTVLRQNISPNGPLNSIKQEFTYNKESQLKHIAKSDWVMGNWLHTEIFELEYNESGDILYYSFELLYTGDEFVKIGRYRFKYNDENGLTERTYHNGMGSEWNPKESNRYRFYYETLKEDENLLFPNIYQFDELNFNWFSPNNKLIKDDYWLTDCGGSIYFVESAIYSYRTITITTNLEVILSNNSPLHIYPNPTTGELIINNEQLTINNVEVFDIYGKCHLSRVKCLEPSVACHASRVTLNISHLSSGFYFVKVSTEAGEVINKILKQ